MKKSYLIAAAILAVCGCQKENGASVEPVKSDKIHAFVNDGVETKTTATPSEDGKSLDFTWAKGDEVGLVTVANSDDVWGKPNNVSYMPYIAYKYTLEGEGGAKDGVFTASEGTPVGDKYIAIYPYSTISNISREVYVNVCYTIPVQQEYVPNGFNTNYAVMYAAAESKDNMQFQHLSSVLNLKVKSAEGFDGVKVLGVNVSAVSASEKIVLKSICGLSYFQKAKNSTEFRHLCGYNNTNTTINYTVPSVVLSSENATEFNVVFNPVCEGLDNKAIEVIFTIEVVTDRGSVTKKKKLFVQRGVVYKMPEIAVNLEPKDLYVFNNDVTAKNLSAFVEGTKNFTSLTVGADGLTTILSAEELTTISKYIMSYGSSDGVTLDLSKVSYVSNVWPNTFRNNTKLKSITLPKNITNGSDGNDLSPFKGCSLLSEVILDDAMKTLPDAFLSGLPALTSFNVTKNVNGLIWLQNNDNTDRLENITVDKENAVLYAIDGVLYRKDGGVNNLEYVPVANTAALTKEGEEYVYTVPEDIVNIRQAAFHRNQNISKIVFNNKLQSIGGYVFGTRKLKVLDFTALDHVPTISVDVASFSLSPVNGEIWCSSETMVNNFMNDAKWSQVAKSKGWTIKVKPVVSQSAVPAISDLKSSKSNFSWK